MENLAATGAVNETCSMIFREYVEGPRNFFVYIEIDNGMISPSVVQIYSDHLLWVIPWGIGDAFHQLWQSASEDAKWYALTLEIQDEKFELQFLYDMPVELADETDNDGEQYDRSGERAKAAILVRFPDLPLRFPPYDQAALERKIMERMRARAASFELGPDHQKLDGDNR